MSKPIRERILQLLGAKPRSIKELVNAVGVTHNTVYVYLCKLRGEGRIEKQPAVYKLKG